MRRVWKRSRNWKIVYQTFGYLPHYHQVGRIKMEVRFILCTTDRKWWTVQNIVTGELMTFRRNGMPANGARGRLVGPIVQPRKVKT